MDQGLKERLIGAAVLVAIAVWLVPWLLDGPDETVVRDADSLQLPVPSGQVGELRTEVIDLGEPRDLGSARGADDASRPTPSAATDDARRSAGRAGDDGAAPSTTVAAAITPAAGGARDSAASNDGAGGTPSAAGTDSTATAARDDGVTADAPRAAAARTTEAASGAASQGAAPAGDWAVQLGSFGDEENARRLADRIAAYGHKPRISDYQSGGRLMYRVRVGPHATRAAAEAAASSLSAHGFVAQVVTLQ